MKTIPEMLNKRYDDPVWILKLELWRDELFCFLFGHKRISLDSIYGNVYPCKRCHRMDDGDKEFYHNWECDRGPIARCHTHK